MIPGAVRRAKLQAIHHHQQTNTQLPTGLLPFLFPNQPSQSTEEKATTILQPFCHNYLDELVERSNILTHTISPVIGKCSIILDTSLQEVLLVRKPVVICWLYSARPTVTLPTALHSPPIVRYQIYCHDSLSTRV